MLVVAVESRMQFRFEKQTRIVAVFCFLGYGWEMSLFMDIVQPSAFDQVSEFDRGRIVTYRDCGLPFREIGSRVGRNQTTVMRISDRWMQEGMADRRGRSHPPQCTTSREDRQICLHVPFDAVYSRVVCLQDVHCLFYLTRNHRRLRRQWCDERRMRAAEWEEVVFTDESRICLQHHDGRIRVWRHRGERMLNSCVMHRHTGPAPVPSQHGSTLNSRRTASPFVRLVEGEERWEAPGLPQGVLLQNWGESELNHSVTCMVLKATANDRRHLALCHDEFRGP
ncbi:transposable element Tcb1 transposase [Trichonephila clavipes]|nr:transposable element Tcb1 transposase [Trichonephila clavipes]